MRYDMIAGSPCIVCRENGHEQKIWQMEKLYRYLKHIGAKETTAVQDRYLDTFSVSVHCRYGLTCHEDSNVRHKAYLIASKIEPMLNDYEKTVIHKHEILMMLSGYFPRAARLLELNCSKYEMKIARSIAGIKEDEYVKRAV